MGDIQEAGRSHGGYREEVRTSSSRSSEIVKVESLPLSEVTSCDELEGGVDVDSCTNNSSDIEVISSPGLDWGKDGEGWR